MAAVIVFTIPGVVVAKGRPRFARRGAHVVAYTPAKTVSYENLVGLSAKVAMAGAGPLSGPVRLSISLTLEVPASWSSKRRALALSGVVRATKRPDIDNFCKGIFDGCNKIVWNDDSQIVEITMRKDYGATPGALVTVMELDGEAA